MSAYTLKQLDLMQLPFARGGSRPGSGRKKTAEESRVIRVPVSLLSTVEKLIVDYKSGAFDSCNANQPALVESGREVDSCNAIQPAAIDCYWLTPEGLPFISAKGFKVRYVLAGVEWSGRGRMPYEIDTYVNEQRHFGRSKQEALLHIEQIMIGRGYRRNVSPNTSQ
jgi:hypothetical protein